MAHSISDSEMSFEHSPTLFLFLEHLPEESVQVTSKIWKGIKSEI